MMLLIYDVEIKIYIFYYISDGMIAIVENSLLPSQVKPSV